MSRCFVTDKMILYSDVVPLNRDNHRSLRLDTRDDRFAFARGTNVVPALVDEFVAAGPHLPILFVPGVGLPVGVFLIGLNSNENILVDADGGWRGDHLPAYVRRWPFVLGEVEGRDPVICIDQTYQSPADGSGEPMFDDKGAETPALIERIRLVNGYFEAAKRNEAFVKRLVELSLLRSVTIDAKFATGASIALHGFLTVDAEKLEALPDAAFLSLRRDGFLAPIYAHLQSLGSVERLRKLHAPALASAPRTVTADQTPAVANDEAAPAAAEMQPEDAA